jgi:hypothetical protein
VSLKKNAYTSSKADQKIPMILSLGGRVELYVSKQTWI